MEKLQIKSNSALSHYLQYCFFVDEYRLPSNTCSLFWHLFASIFLLPFYIFSFPLSSWTYWVFDRDMKDDGSRFGITWILTVLWIGGYIVGVIEINKGELDYNYFTWYVMTIFYVLCAAIVVCLAGGLLYTVIKGIIFLCENVNFKKPQSLTVIQESVKSFKEKHCKPVNWIR